MTSGGWGSSGESPWADPSTPTEPGAPYAGPPPTTPQYGAPPAYGYPQPYGAIPWGVPYGYPPPRPPQRPGQVITAAVLAFAQALVVLIASLYVWFFASIIDVAGAEGDYAPGTALATEATVLAAVQVVSVVLLIGAGIWALNSRRRPAGVLLAVALGVQVVLAAYWLVRLQSEFGGFEGDGTIVAFSLFFAAGPLVGLGMVLIGPGRRWFDGTTPAGRQP